MSYDESRGGGSNLKYPKLTGPKMRGYWQAVKMIATLIFQENEPLMELREAMRSFRRRWGAQPPVTEGQWLAFWQELSASEDYIDGLRNHLTKFHFEMHDVVDRGLEIVEQNGVSGLTDPIADIRRLAEVLPELVDD